MRSALKVVNVVISTSSTTTSSSDNSDNDNNDNEGKKKMMKKKKNKPLTNPIDALGGSFAFLEYLNVVFTRHLSVGKAWHDLEHEIR